MVKTKTEFVERFGLKKLIESKAVKKLTDDAFFAAPYADTPTAQELAPFIGHCNLGKIHHSDAAKHYRVVQVPLSFSTISIFTQNMDAQYYPVLTPLSAITDEDFIQLAELVSGAIDFEVKRENGWLIAISGGDRMQMYPGGTGDIRYTVDGRQSSLSNIFQINPLLTGLGYDVYNWIEVGKAFNKTKLK